MNPPSTRTIRPVSCVAVVCVTAVAFGILPWPGPSTVPVAFAQQGDAGKKQKKDPASTQKGQEKKQTQQTPKPSTRAARGSRGQKSGARQRIPSLDPDFEKRLREIADSEAARVSQKQRERRAGKATQRSRAGEVKASRTPRAPGAAGRGAKIPAARSADGSTTTLNIPPIDDGIAPEDRMYTFSIKDGTYEELVEGFARQTGLGVIGSAPRDGKVAFISTQELTFEQALNRVRMLLFKYKPHEPYWLERHETHLEVIRVTDKTRFLELSLMFPSVEEFAAAGLPDNELALVIYTPKSGSLSDLKVVRDFMPDYVRVTPLEDGSSVTIFALVKDINKYLDLVPLFVGRKGDPRTIEKIRIEHILPSDAVEQLGQLMDLTGSSRVRPTGRRSKEISPLDTLRDPEVTLLPIDAQGVVIVRAMQDRIEEIKQLLPYIDVDARAGGLQPVVIEVEHGDAGELISTIHQIMAAALATVEGTTGTKTPRRSPRRTTTPSTSTPATLSRLTLLLHPSKSAIIVVTDDEEELQYVRRLVKEFDVPGQRREGVRIPLVHADAAEMASTIKLVFTPPKGTLEQFRLAADPAGDAIWFTGPQKDLERIRELVEIMDRPDQAVSLHIVTLRRQPATLVASILREYESSTAGSAPGRRRTPGVKPRPAAASKFTPNDDQSRIFVLCTDAEWVEYETIIRELDSLDEPPFFSRLEVAHLEPETATEQLSSLMTAGPGKPSVRFIATEGAVLVMNASEAHLEDIKTLLAEIDRPADIQQRIFEIKYRAPSDIRTAIEALLGAGDGGGAARRRPRPDARGVLVSTTAGVTVIEAGHRLIVRATPDKMAEVAKLIGDLDVEEDDIQIKVFREFPPGADIDALADRLRSLFPGAASPSRVSSVAGRGSAGSTAQFLPQSAAGELVVIASRSLLPRIEQYLDVLANYMHAEEQVIEFIPVEHAYPDEIVTRIQPLLDLKVRQLLDRGMLGGGGAELGATAAAVAQRRARRTGGGGSEHYHIEADAVNDRIIIAAPVVLVEEVRELVRLFDTPPEAGMIFKSVELVNADPPSMVNAIREMMGQRKLATQRQPAGQSGPVVQPVGDRTLSIVQAPSGSAIVLHGLPKEVEQAADWIVRLDAVSSRGRAIKVYQIEHADIKKIVDLIMNVVDAPAPGPTLPRPRPRSGMETEEPLWELTKTWVGHQIYVHADFMAGTMLVAAREGKLAEIDEIVAQFDVEDAVVFQSGGAVPSFMYDLEYAEDAIEAELTLEMLLEQFWQPRDELPEVDAALFGNYLIIRYPHAERFDEIRDMIREHVDKRPKGWAEQKKKGFPVPSGISATDTALWIRMNRPDLDIEIVDRSKAEDNTFNVEVLKPYQQDKPNPCVLPRALLRAADLAVSNVLAQHSSDGQAQNRDDADDQSPSKQEPAQPSSDELIRAAAQSFLEGRRTETAGDRNADGPAPADAAPRAERITIYVDDTTGGLIIRGPSGILEEVPDWLEELEEEIRDLPRPPDFRVVRVRYIDVFTAAEVLEEMFNATRQQRQMVQQQQRAAQQRLRQQQQLAARQRQQQAAKGQQPDQQQQRGQQRGQQQIQTPQLPPTSVRIYPSPRDRTLILRADTSQYPAILELLATIDRPQPIDNKLKIFKLVKLNAADVEELLTELLDLDAKRETTASKSSGSKRSTTRRAPQRRGPAGRLPRTLMQDMVSGVGALGVDPGDIKLSSNEAANTLVVMAPQVAVTFIGDIIDQLESEDMPERTAKHYELTHADAQELADYLTTHFEEKRLGTRRAEGGKSGTASGSSFNTPSFVAYPRLNLLTALASQEQLDEVDELVVRFDVTSEEDRWQDVALRHADAKVVADTLTSMFAAPPGGGASGGAKKSKFVGDQGGRILFFSAPESLREDILATITKLEKEAEDDTTVRIIRLTHQEPGKIAEAIEAAYRGGKGGAEPVRFTVSAHDPSKLLFVKADDVMFAEIESLAKTLDQPGSFDFEFRIYPLQHANARQVHDILSKLVKDYLGRLGGKKNIEPFSIEVDDRANALIVLGSPVVFGFLEETLPKIDNPAAAVGKPGFMMFSLKNADAEQVAQNIARLWSDKTLPEGETPPHAEANRALNVLIVRGTQAQLDEIKTEFIDPLETQGPRQREKTIKLTYANPSTVQDAIQQLFGAGRNPRDKVIAVSDFGSNSIIVSGSPQNLIRVEDLVAKLDTAESEQREVHVIHVENVDAESVTQTLTEMFIRSMPTPAKGQAPPVSITALKGSRAVMVKCRKELFAEIEALVAKMDRGESVIGESVRIIQLLYSDATEMHGALENYLKKPGGRTGELAGDVRISVLAQSNALVVSGSKETVEQLESTISMLDQAGEKGSVPQIIPLEYITAGDIAASLQEMFTEGGGRGGKRPPVITADEARNNLLIRASASDLTAIQTMVERLDTEDRLPENFRLLQLAPGMNLNELAEKVSQTINESVKTRRGKGRGALSLSVTPMPYNNVLMLGGSPSLFDDAERMVRTLEEMAPPGGRGLRIIQLGQVAGDDITRLIDRLRGDSDGGGRSRRPRSRPSRRPSGGR